MTTKNEKKYSLGIVAIYTLLMTSFVWVQLNVFGVFDPKEVKPQTTQQDIDSNNKIRHLNSRGMYLVLKKSYDTPKFQDANAKERTLEQFYRLRAYLGAPPAMPHISANEKDSNVAGYCNNCHKMGGFVSKYNAYTPITPHPEMENCTQCHVPIKKNNLFRQTAWQKDKKVLLGQSALPGSPPIIPHPVEMRENCQSCHVGPAAVREIRVSHPERINCTQCHVVRNKKIVAQGSMNSIWTRKNEK